MWFPCVSSICLPNDTLLDPPFIPSELYVHTQTLEVHFFLIFLFINLVAPGLIYLFIFIFIFGCVESSFLCEGFLQLRQAGATHHRGAWTPSLSRPLLLRSTGSRRADSVVVAHGPSCSAACGILPDQGSNLCPLHQQADSQPLRHEGSPRGAF